MMKLIKKTLKLTVFSAFGVSLVFSQSVADPIVYFDRVKDLNSGRVFPTKSYDPSKLNALTACGQFKKEIEDAIEAKISGDAIVNVSAKVHHHGIDHLRKGHKRVVCQIGATLENSEYKLGYASILYKARKFDGFQNALLVAENTKAKLETDEETALTWIDTGVTQRSPNYLWTTAIFVQKIKTNDPDCQ